MLENRGCRTSVTSRPALMASTSIRLPHPMTDTMWQLKRGWRNSLAAGLTGSPSSASIISPLPVPFFPSPPSVSPAPLPEFPLPVFIHSGLLLEAISHFRFTKPGTGDRRIPTTGYAARFSHFPLRLILGWNKRRPLTFVIYKR